MHELAYKHAHEIDFDRLSPTPGIVGVIMGSRSDWPYMRPCCDVLDQLAVPFEYGIVSAHRTHKRMERYAESALHREIDVIIACAGGSAHLPGMVASMTLAPVLGVAPKKSDEHAVGSMIAMPFGAPLAYMGGGSAEYKNAGAQNAALFAIRILAFRDGILFKKLSEWVSAQAKDVPYTCHD